MHLARTASRTLLILPAAALILAALLISALVLTPPAHARHPARPDVPTPDPGPAPHCGQFHNPFPRMSPPAVVQPILHQHDPAPHLPPGTTVRWMDVFGINGAGSILFGGILQGPGVSEANDLIDFYASEGGTQVLAREGQQAWDMPESVIISSLLCTSDCLAENGMVALIPGLGGPGIVPGYNDRVLYAGYPGELHKVLQGGTDQAPGCEPGVYVDVSESVYPYFRCYLSNNGTLRVEAKLAGPGVTYLNDSAVWVGPPDDLVLAYREGTQAIGCPVGVTYFGGASFAHNDLGQVSFCASLRGSGVTSANDSGHWAGAPSSLTLVAREGSQAPAMPVGVTWRQIVTGTPDINSWGDLTQEGFVQGPGVSGSNDGVMYGGEPEALILGGRKGDPVPEAGTDATIASLGSTLINDYQQAFYRVKLAGTGISDANQWTMYLGSYGGAELSLRDGNPAPTFNLSTTLWRVSAVPNLAGMNAAGDIAVPTEIQGRAVTDADKVVLWMRHHVLQRWVPLLRSGMEIDGRTLYADSETAFPCGATGGSDGRHRMLNDSAVLAAKLTFTDGTHGIYRLCFPFGDGNRDGRVDGADWFLMQNCWSGVDNSPQRDGAVFDMDADGDVDLTDWAQFQQLYSGG